MKLWPKFYNAKKTKRTEQPNVSSRRYFLNGKYTYVDEDTAMTIAAFNRGVIYVATQMAKLPWDVKNKENKIQENHELNYLLNRSCTSDLETTAFMVKVFMIISAITHGNAYLEIERNMTGKIVGLHPIPTADVQVMRTDAGKLVYVVSNGSKGQVVLMPREIFHMRNFHTMDGIMGQGVVNYASETLGISLGGNRFANALYSNSGMPSGAIETDGKLSQDAVDRMRASWQSATSGRKTGSVVVLEEGTKFNPITFAPDVLQFIESRKFGVPEIARFLGVPPTKLYSQEQATYNNNEQDNLSVVNDTLSAWASNMEKEADLKFFGKNMRLHTDIDLFEIAKGDMDTRATYYTKMMGVGAITPNEIRVKEGMTPYDDGNRHYIATNNFTPSDKVDEVVAGKTNSEKTPLEEAALNYLKK